MPSGDSVLAFVQSLNIEPVGELDQNSSLIQSGLLDSAALLNLAEWIEGRIGGKLDLTTFDLAQEWDTAADIEEFISRHTAGSN